MAGSDVGTAMDLPQGYAKIVDILGEKVTAGGFLNVIGIVVDFQKPIPTKGGGMLQGLVADHGLA